MSSLRSTLRGTVGSSLKLLLAPALAASLGGCTAQWEDDHAYWVSAEPLFPTDTTILPYGATTASPAAMAEAPTDSKIPPPPPPLAVYDPSKPEAAKAYLGLIIGDSEAKCDRFMNRLSVAESSGDTGLDMATGVFSALGTAFTPLSTVHALTAASTITSGFKASIDSDVYAKAAIKDYAQAIQASYYADMKTYATALNSAKDPLVVPIELATIARIHAECSLESAQNTISTTLKSSSSTSSTQNSATLNLDGSLTAKGQLTVTATSNSFSKSVSSTIPDPANPSTAADALATAINGDPVLTKAGVTATHSFGSMDIAVSWPKSVDITWSPVTMTPPPNGKFAAAAFATSKTVGHVTQSTAPSSPADRSGSVPGHPL